jgi:helix-turn-helix protein
MNLTEAAHVLGISARTLRLAVERGEIEANHPLADGPWVFKRSALETPAAATLVARVRRQGQQPTIPSSEQPTFGFSPISST